MSALAIAGTLGLGGAGAFVGWWGGLLLCPDWGDLGFGAIPWCVGGAIVGGVAGVTAGMTVLG